MENVLCEKCVLHPGDIIDNHYRMHKLLGEGSFGCVYQVRDMDSGVDYALKMLKLWEINQEDRTEFLKRFDMEYVTGQINSNYLVHSYNKGTIQGNPYILMEFCPKGDLRDAVVAGEVNLAKVAREVLYGLRDLHLQGKVHRDLKPENVLLRNDGTAVLTDFGISGDQNHRLTKRGILGVPQQIFGTYAYMPPEQLNPKRGNATVLPTTDIFSFGVMLFQMLTFRLPFGELNSPGDLPKYNNRAKVGLWDRNVLLEIPDGKAWEPLIDGCLNPNFKKRLQKVDEVLDLMPFSDDEGYRPVWSDSLGKRNIVNNGLLLRVMQGPEFEKEYRLDELVSPIMPVITMGRECDEVFNVIPIKDLRESYVSRCHCTLEKNKATGQWIIRDGQWRNGCRNALRMKMLFPCRDCTAYCKKPEPFVWKTSTNGTYVNSTEVDQTGKVLNPGDIITIGDIKLRVEGY